MTTPIGTPVSPTLFFGALAFGLVIGWSTYRTLVRIDQPGWAQLTSMVGVVGGAAVTALFPSTTDAFGAYCIGLAIGFFGYAIAALRMPHERPPGTTVLGGEASGSGEDLRPPQPPR